MAWPAFEGWISDIRFFLKVIFCVGSFPSSPVSVVYVLGLPVHSSHMMDGLSTRYLGNCSSVFELEKESSMVNFFSLLLNNMLWERPPPSFLFLFNSSNTKSVQFRF